MVGRARAWGAAATVVIGLGVVPLALGRDSFPVSDYPMFAASRTRAGWVPTAEGVAADGSYRWLTPALIGGTDEPMLAMVTVREAVEHDRADGLCREIAERVGRHPDAPAEVAVTMDEVDAVGWFAGDRRVLRRVEVARCPVVTG